MKKIGFIGAYEKTDLITYVAKILVECGKSVLIIDSTIQQRARYIVPAISPSVYYITEYEGVEVAVGFENLQGMIGYIGTQTLEYDIVLIDIDSNEKFKGFDMEEADKNYFVTGFDNYSLKKGLEIIEDIEGRALMTKVLFSRDMHAKEEDYLNFLSMNFPIEWNEEKIYFPYEQGDSTVIIENQRASKIRFRNLSQEYKNGLFTIIEEILPDIGGNEIRKIFKRI